jgi:hypothetical protein
MSSLFVIVLIFYDGIHIIILNMLNFFSFFINCKVLVISKTQHVVLALHNIYSISIFSWLSFLFMSFCWIDML